MRLVHLWLLGEIGPNQDYKAWKHHKKQRLNNQFNLVTLQIYDLLDAGTVLTARYDLKYRRTATIRSLTDPEPCKSYKRQDWLMKVKELKKAE